MLQFMLLQHKLKKLLTKLLGAKDHGDFYVYLYLYLSIFHLFCAHISLIIYVRHARPRGGGGGHPVISS